MHHDRVRLHQFKPCTRQAPHAGVLAARREERAVHPFALHPQGVHHVGVGQQRIEVVCYLDVPIFDRRWQQRRRSDQGDVGAQQPQGLHFRTGNPRVHHVADDHGVAASQVAKVAPHREDVQQRLGWVLVPAVASVQNGDVEVARKL